MVDKFIPEINKIYFINKYSLFHILEGNGSIQVNFQNYHDWSDKLIFLEKGQYIKFLSDQFVVRRIEFKDDIFFKNKDVRVLFKHLVSLGYIDFNDCLECQKYLNDTVFSTKASDIIDISSQQWYWQNPFHANQEEYHIIFDIKEIIDKKFQNHLSNHELSKLINQRGYDAHALFKNKIGITIKKMLGNKRLLESKKTIAFTDKSIKEIAYDFGYSDPAYFNKVFKQSEGKSPTKFRADFEYKDFFLQELYDLLQQHHQQERNIDFYAQKMHLSVKTLSHKIKDKLNISMGQLIRQKMIDTAKKMLKEDLKINEIAYQLGFEEANHFSAFFKHHTNITPSAYKNKKYK